MALAMPLLVSSVVLASPTDGKGSVLFFADSEGVLLLRVGQRDRLAALVEQRLSQGHELWLIAEAADATGPHETTLASQADRPRSHKRWAGDSSEFFRGAFVAFLGHEAGHLIANLAVGSSPDLKGVEFSIVPFFTIEPGRKLSDRQHYITASAGFNAQHIINEWLLEKHPNLRNEDEPFLKGLATLNFWLTVGYSATAFAGYGPDERDTKGMADSLGWSEDSIGALILVPAALPSIIAGLRVGWAYCPAGVADALNRVRGPFNVNAAAQAAAVAALQDVAFADGTRTHNDIWRAWLGEKLAALGLHVFPSVANFVLVRFAADKARNAAAADAYLQARGIVPRRMEPYGLPDCLRITVGTEEECRATVAALADFLAGKPA